jgi:IstB-like ATP binding protein
MGNSQIARELGSPEHVRAPIEWKKIFTDQRLCQAVVDRITFQGTFINTGADSYRLAATEAKLRRE